ncbi:PHP domain-containing protein [Cohnella sp. CFH 77786]|uniref:PHP domain-containing protein n=1 Tax=Cohnella sp. CFH 77786 TaxID=2662265 RepID=UPI001C60E882|nr:PHP domain-containing protein [Cohnella sp. CFH 77786]MBW5444685.1 PHP domain-containing protein [Cohnella sp. CFH 77786]
MSRADLHTHTTASDGRHRPAEVVRMAKEAGLAAVAITDHDTVAGVAEALAAGAEYGIRVIPGVEISTSAEGKDIHILGYGFAPDDPVLLDRLVSLRQVRARRNAEIVAKLNALGVEIAMDEVEREASASPRGDGSIGRPHMAGVLVRKGYAKDMRDAFNRYLAEGAAAYANPPRIGPLDAVRWIHEAGGAAIVAHPGLYRNDRLVLELLDGGADGLEAHHSDHDVAMERHYKTLAKSRGKLVTGGSDFHGTREGIVFHGRVGNRTVDAVVLDRLLAVRPS